MTRKKTTTEKPRRKRGRPPRFTRDELLALITRHRGNVASAAAEAGVPRATVYRRLYAEDLIDQARAMADQVRAEEKQKQAEEEARAAALAAALAAERDAERDEVRKKFMQAFDGGDTGAMLGATIEILDLDGTLLDEDAPLKIAKAMAAMAEAYVTRGLADLPASVHDAAKASGRHVMAELRHASTKAAIRLEHERRKSKGKA